ncbi:MAG: endonuclease MutS2 [Nitrospinota bacterium]
MNKEHLLEKSKNSLEWSALLTHLESEASSEAGKKLCSSLLPEVSEETIEILQTETAEMLALLREDAFPPLPPFPDLRKEIKSTEKQIVLDPPTLRQISGTIRLADSIRSFFNSTTGQLSSQLATLSSRLTKADELRKEIERAVDETGEIKESASSVLANLYAEQRNVRESVKKRLEPYLTGEQYRPAIRENYTTVRDDRFVIPVKSEMQKKIDGIIHDSSQSGMTLFVEPRDMIPLNNRLRLLNLKIEKEVNRILGKLSGLVSGQTHELLQNMTTLACFDLIKAKGNLALKMDATRPVINRSGVIKIKEARHPLLTLQEKETVPNDLTLGGEVRVLVISGPNTGGKTVMLKTAGLLSLMLRAGLHIPARHGSELPVFTEVFADIGDEQNISYSLSTFAGHLKNVACMVKHISPLSLVLLDEFMASTDPSEGSALAESILDRLAHRNAITIVSTHFSKLKYTAAEKEHYLNGCMEINTSSLLPTYRLIQGIPGRSHALAIARRLGMDSAILDDAERRLGREERNSEKLAELLELKRQELQLEKERVLFLREEAEDFKRESQEIRDDLKKEKIRFKQEKAFSLKKEIGKAKEEIHQTLQELRGQKTKPALKKASETIRRIEKSGDMPPDLSGCAPLSTFYPGDYVLIPALRVSGAILSISVKKNLVKINTGNAELTVNSQNVLAKKVKPPAPKLHGNRALRRTHIKREEPFSQECSFRGLTQTVAMEKLIQFLDEATRHEAPSVKLIHGHGTGVLKKSIREYLETSPYSKSFEPGLSNEGGDGVTIVTLRE